jgi:protein-S-isoprenylcysteine O-methyltransferase Ste14
MLDPNREHWLSRPPAKTFFKFAFIMTLALFAFIVFAFAGLSIAGEDRMQHFLSHWWVQALGFLVGVVGAPCALGLWIGMLSHLASANRIAKSGKAVWFFLLIFGNWIAAPFYYFVSYRKQSAEGTPYV